jgi:histidinol-phosphate aminotransferase
MTTRDTEHCPNWATPAIRALPMYRRPATFADFPDPATRPRLLQLNESPDQPSPRAIDAAIAAMRDLNRYPDIAGGALTRAIGARLDVPEDRIVLGCGSDELIHFTTVVALSAGDTAVVPAPSFPRYALSARLAGAQPIRAKLDANGACDADAILRAIGPRTRLVVACTPNPPSGGMMEAGGLRALAEGVPGDVLLLIDEAYLEFGQHAGGPDAAAILRNRKGPWLSTRTFSKAHALAGLRIGYAICGDDTVAEALRRARLQFSVPAPSQAAALAAFEDQAHLAASVARVAAERERLAAGLAALGLKVWPSAANFVSCSLPGPAAAAMQALERDGILVRDWRDPEFPNELRIGVGTRTDTDAVLASLARHARSAA